MKYKERVDMTEEKEEEEGVETSANGEEDGKGKV